MEENIEEEKVHSKKKRNLTESFRENPWIVSTFVLGVFALILIITSFTGGLTGKSISADDAGEGLISYLDSVGYSGFELQSINKVGGMYEINTIYEDEEVPFYVTKTGYIIGNSLISILEENEVEPEQEPTQEIPKLDKPVVELFIMTHCPYGTQAEKGFIPMMKEFADVLDAQIRFVHYFMHEPEETETPKQVCIREEQADKYLDYLECFLEGDGVDEGGYIKNGNNPSACMKKAGVDETKVNTCVNSGKAEEYYDADSKLSQEYGVQGSPTLVINGMIVSSGRSAAAYLDTVCQAFTNVPEECALSLDSQTPSPYFGWETTGTTSAGQC